MVVWRYSYRVSGVLCLAMELIMRKLELSVDSLDIEHIVSGVDCNTRQHRYFVYIL